MVQNPMKTKREKLESLLLTICKNVYYQPPSNVRPPNIQMTYPAIRFRRADMEKTYADNISYLTDVAFEVTVIDRDPDSFIAYQVSQLPYANQTGHYTAENLNHDRFIIYA